MASLTRSICAGSLTGPVPGILTESGIDAYRTPQPSMTAAGRHSAFVCIGIVLPTLMAATTYTLCLVLKTASALQGLGSLKHCTCESCLQRCQELRSKVVVDVVGRSQSMCKLCIKISL